MQALVSTLTAPLTVQAQAKEEQVYGAVNLKMSTASISKWVNNSSRKFCCCCCCFESHMWSQPPHPPFYFSIMSEEWFQWQTMAPTRMVPSFSSHTPNSPTWIWSTQCLESMSSFCWGSLDTVPDVSSVIVALVSLSSTPHRVIDGLETLDELEKQPVNEKTFRLLTETRIKDVTIHANPFAV